VKKKKETKTKKNPPPSENLKTTINIKCDTCATNLSQSAIS